MDSLPSGCSNDSSASASATCLPMMEAMRAAAEASLSVLVMKGQVTTKSRYQLAACWVGETAICCALSLGAGKHEGVSSAVDQGCGVLGGDLWRSGGVTRAYAWQHFRPEGWCPAGRSLKNWCMTASQSEMLAPGTASGLTSHQAPQCGVPLLATQHQVKVLPERQPAKCKEPRACVAVLHGDLFCLAAALFAGGCNNHGQRLERLLAAISCTIVHSRPAAQLAL